MQCIVGWAGLLDTRLTAVEVSLHGRCSRITGNPESAGINRHVVGDARALQEGK